MKRIHENTHDIIQKCIRALKRAGFDTIGGKDLRYCTYPMISTYFEKKFGYNPLNDDIRKILSKNKYSNRTDEFIYFITTDSEEFCKIGYCINPEEVLYKTQKTYPDRVYIYALFRGDDRLYEKIKSIYKDLHVQGKWFKFKNTDLKRQIEPIKSEFKGLDRPFLQIRNGNEIFATNLVSSGNLKLYVLLNENENTCKRIITTDDISYFDTEDWKMVFKKEYNPHVRKTYLQVKMKKYSKYLIPGSTNLYKYRGILQRDIMNNDI